MDGPVPDTCAVANSACVWCPHPQKAAPTPLGRGADIRGEGRLPLRPKFSHPSPVCDFTLEACFHRQGLENTPAVYSGSLLIQDHLQSQKLLKWLRSPSPCHCGPQSPLFWLGVFPPPHSRVGPVRVLLRTPTPFICLPNTKNDSELHAADKAMTALCYPDHQFCLGVLMCKGPPLTPSRHKTCAH